MPVFYLNTAGGLKTGIAPFGLEAKRRNRTGNVHLLAWRPKDVLPGMSTLWPDGQKRQNGVITRKTA